jgi:cell division protein FtsI/penicillin-binding protein 2
MRRRPVSRPRALLLLALLLVFGAATAGRLAYWQLVRQDWLVAQAREQVTVLVEIPAARGTVYDRSGVVALATSVQRDLLAAFPAQLASGPGAAARRAATAAHLAYILDLDAAAAAALRERLDSGRAYVVLARDLTAAQSREIREALAAGDVHHVRLEPEAVRVYPLEGGAPGTSLASHVLGFVNREGHGQYGIEEYWQAELAGIPQVLLAERDASNQPNLARAEVIAPGSPGADLILTIDASLQLALEREIYAAWVANEAVRVSAVVMDPRTGAILAQATYPAYDGNRFQEVADKDPGRFVDPVVSAVYEPGSVFKMVAAAAALEAGIVTPTSIVSDGARLKLDGGRTFVTNADKRSRGRMTFEDAVAWSRNVVLSKVALELGETTEAAARALYGTWQRLGFGAPTGVDLAGEVGGLVRDPAASAWREIDLANGSFGQGVAVTVLQLATAFSAMVNGGILPTPHVVQSVGIEPRLVPEKGRVLSPELAAELLGLLRHVPMAVPVIGNRTLIPGYAVGGKTGTAQIWDSEKGRWKPGAYNYSFVGFAGRASADVVVAVRIEEARPAVQRIGVLELPIESFELFRRIAADALNALSLPPAPASAGSEGSGR